MSVTQSKSAQIVGAGLAGSLLACALAQRGWKVDVFERRADPRAKGYVGGRSINLALSARGLAALRAVGLEQLVMEKDAIPMRGRMVHARDGKTVLQPYSSNANDAINSVSRGGLNLTLIEAAAKLPGVAFHFDSPCIDVDFGRNESVFGAADGHGVAARAGARLVVGADGAFSAVRLAMQKTDRFEFSQNYLEHGYKELHIPTGTGGAFLLEKNALHIWPRGGAMMIALPNRDGSFTCTLFWPFEGEHSFANLKSESQIREFFEREYPDAVPLMPTLVEDFQRNPTSSLVTIRCWPWVRGRVCLLGDAAHAIVPFYGQGMNCAFEDCVALISHLDAVGSGDGAIEAALYAFEAERKPHAEAIADMAIENFVEMRDKVGRPEFLYRKKVEQAIHAAIPDRVTPQYNLVSFSTVPYAEARRRGRELDLVIDAVVKALPPGDGGFDDAWRARVGGLARRIIVESPRNHAAKESDLIDISPALTSKIGVWPTDTPLSREVLCDLDKGDNITLSTLRSTVHLGSHADGPNHYGKGARGVGEQRLTHYVGPCCVVDAKIARGQRVRVADLVDELTAVTQPRVLVRTGTFPDPHQFNEDFAALSVELVEALAERGVITIGLDTPSVDIFTSKALEAHHAILKHDIAILEGLVLKDVVAGEYELIALPLKLVGFDASPVRAVLRRL